MAKVALAAFVAVVGWAAPCSGLTGALCQLPGNCTTAWSQQSLAGVISTGDPLYLNHVGCAPGADCYTPTGTGLPLNLYIGWANDATVPWTLAQKQMWVALFTAIGTSTWLRDMAAMYPPTDVWGAQQGTTLSLTNCLSGSPAHCADFTYTPGLESLGDCPGVTLPSDPYGVYIEFASQPNTSCAAGQGSNVVNLPGHCVCGSQSIDAVHPTCLGGTIPSPFGTVNAFTTPAIGSSAVVTLASGTYLGGSNYAVYVEGAGWYTVDFGGSTSANLTNRGSVVNAAPGTPIAGGTSIERSPAPLTPNGCTLDSEISIVMTELVAAVENFHGQGWAHYSYPAFPPAPSPNSTNPAASHEDCPITGFGDLTIYSGQFASDLAITMFSTNYNFITAPWLRNSQVGSGLPNGPWGYCAGHRSLPDYWNTPCRQNSDCPAASGVCSGTAIGSHCLAPSCADGIQNGFETDVDCGGFCPNPCGLGKKCQAMNDCQSQFAFGGTFTYCVSGICTSY